MQSKHSGRRVLGEGSEEPLCGFLMLTPIQSVRRGSELHEMPPWGPPFVLLSKQSCKAG